MNSKKQGFAHGMAGVAAIFLMVVTVRAASGVWTGTTDSFWTNSANWNVSPYPAGGQTATFANDGGGRTEIDLAGLATIKNITFTSAGLAAYTIGSGGAKAQTLVLENQSDVTLDATSANVQTFNANLQLGTDRNGTTNVLRNDCTAHALILAGHILVPNSGGIVGYKTVNIYGAGETRLLGDFLRLDRVALLYIYGSGTLTLSGSNHITRLSGYGVPQSRIDIAGYLCVDNPSYYPLSAYQDTVIDGSGTFRMLPVTTDNTGWVYVLSGKTLTVNLPILCSGGLNLREAPGTLVLNGLNQIASNIVISAGGTVSAAILGNRGSGGNNLGQGERVVLSGNGSRLLYTGAGETSDRILEVSNNATLDHSGTGELIFTEDLVIGGNVKTLTLQGSANGIGVLGGAIGAGSAATSVSKNGAGMWRLSGANTYAGATTVSNGTLVLTGVNGAAASSSGFAISSGCTLQLNNAVGANNTDRLGDAATVILNGGTLSFFHTGGAADYSETAGPLTVLAGVNKVVASQADDLRVSSLTFASLVHSVGTIDFIGTGLGESGRNRIFITGQADGLIGPWATVNGSSLAAYSSVRGVYAAGDAGFTDFAARGPDPDSVLPDDAAVFARINLPGTSGPMTLAGVWSNSVRMIQQNTAIDATVATRAGATNKTLLTEGVLIAPDKASLTIGGSAGDGLLMALYQGGDLMLANEATNSTLTINAVVTNNTGASSLTKSGAGNVTLAGAARYTGPTALQSGTLTYGSTSNQTLPGTISGAGSLAKTGAGSLRLGGDNAYAGETLIGAGTVLVDHSNALGPNGAGTVVSSNATLDVGGALAANALKLGPETITISGTGVDGKGVIINSSAVEQRFALYNAKVSLAGDAGVGGYQRFGFWPDNLSPLLDLNGHTLSKLGTNIFSIINTDVNPGGGHIDVKEGAVWLVYSTRLNGGVTNILTVRADAFLKFYELWEPPIWTLALNNRSHLNVFSGAVPYNVWDGPITLNGTVFLDGNNNSTYSMRLNGPISGSGPLVKTDPLTAYLANTNNTYVGGTIVSNGILTVAHTRSLPGYDTPNQVTVAPAGTLAVLTSDGVTGWTKAQIDTLRATAAFTTSSAAVGLDTSSGDFVYDRDIAQAFSLAKCGTNALTLTGDNACAGQLRVQGGSLTLAAEGTNAFGSALVTGAGSLLNINGPLTLTNYGSLTNGNANGDRSVLRIATNVTIMSTGNSAASAGKLFVGNGVGSAGAVYQSGGRVSSSTGLMYTDYVSIGTYGGYGYYRMTGGELVSGEIGVTGAGVGANVGVFDLYGGSIINDGAGFLVGWAQGTGVLNLFGGSLVVTKNLIHVTYSRNMNTFGMINLLGPAASVNATGTTPGSQTLNMAYTNGNKASVVNLNSGIFNINKIFAGSPGTPSFFNFNGGTLRPNAAQSAFMQGLTAATVYSGGAVIDSAGFNITLNQQLKAPTGYGVVALALASGGAGYIGAPAVQIDGGSGSNATAIAHVDLDPDSPTCGQVTGFTVTSPGFGYQSSDNLTVTLLGGGFLKAATAGALTKGLNNGSGGLTKLGTGILTLGGMNTYAGATIISNGTVKLAVAKALPTGTTVVLAGGTLDLGGFTVTNTLLGGNGTVSNGTMQVTFSPAGAGNVGGDAYTPGNATVKGRYVADVALDGTCDLLTIQGNINLSNFSLELVNPALLSKSKTYTVATVAGARSGFFTMTNLPDSRWHVLYLADGSVRLAFVDGTLYMLR